MGEAQHKILKALEVSYPGKEQYSISYRILYARGVGIGGMEGQSIDDMTAFAIGKLQGGWSQDQVAASIQEMLAAEGWPQPAIEAMLAQVATQVTTQTQGQRELRESYGSPRREGKAPRQSDPTRMMMEMMQQMMSRMEALEKARIAPTTPQPQTPTPIPLPTGVQKTGRSKYPDPERFDGDRNKYPQFRYEAKAKLRHSSLHQAHSYQIDYIMSRTKDRASKTLLPWVERNIQSATIDELWAFMDRQFKDPHQRSRALDKLRHLSQGRRLVRDYISEFN